MPHVASYQSYVQLSCHWPVVAIMPRKNGRQLGVQSCCMPGLPVHLMQELETGTVYNEQCVGPHNFPMSWYWVRIGKLISPLPPSTNLCVSISQVCTPHTMNVVLVPTTDSPQCLVSHVRKQHWPAQHPSHQKHAQMFLLFRLVGFGVISPYTSCHLVT